MNPARRGSLLAPVLVQTTVVISIVSSLGAPLIATVARHFHDSLSTAQWSLTVAMLSGAVSAPVLGRLGDGPRRRDTMIGTLISVTAGGVIAALAPNLVTLIIGRGLQGVGLGLVPLAMATARDEMPPDKARSMIGVLSVSTAAGAGAGYPISGLIADVWGLRGAFWFGTIVSALALVGVALVVPVKSVSQRSPRLDWLGMGLLAVALVALLVGIAEGTDWRWGSARVISLLAVGVVGFAIWTLQQLRCAVPLVDLRLLRHPSVLTGNACAVVLSVAMYMYLSGMPDFVQTPRSRGFGFSASVVVAGLILIPMSALMMVGSRVLPLLVRRLGLRTVLPVGSGLAGVSGAYFAMAHNALWESFVMMGVLGIALGTTFAAIPGLIVQAVPADETGSAMGFYQVVRYAGFSVGSALTASVLASRSTVGHEPTLAGYTTLLWMATGVCVAAGIVVLALRPAEQEWLAEDRLADEEVRSLEENEGFDYLARRA